MCLCLHLLADLRTNNRQLGKVRVKVKYKLVYNLYCGVTQISPQILLVCVWVNGGRVPVVSLPAVHSPQHGSDTLSDQCW